MKSPFLYVADCRCAFPAIRRGTRKLLIWSFDFAPRIRTLTRPSARSVHRPAYSSGSGKLGARNNRTAAEQEKAGRQWNRQEKRVFRQRLFHGWIMLMLLKVGLCLASSSAVYLSLERTSFISLFFFSWNLCIISGWCCRNDRLPVCYQRSCCWSKKKKTTLDVWWRTRTR